jgi:hypothetical protein
VSFWLAAVMLRANAFFTAALVLFLSNRHETPRTGRNRPYSVVGNPSGTENLNSLAMKTMKRCNHQPERELD